MKEKFLSPASIKERKRDVGKEGVKSETVRAARELCSEWERAVALQKAVAECLSKKTARNKDKQLVRDGRKALQASRSLTSRISRQCRRLLTGVVLAGVLGGVTTEVLKYFPDQHAPASSSDNQEPVSKGKISLIREALGKVVGTMDGYEENYESEQDREFEFPEPTDEEKSLWAQKRLEEEAQQRAKKAEEDEQQRKADEEYKSEVKVNTKLVVDKILRAAADVGSGEDLEDLIKDEIKYSKSEVYEMIEQDAKRLESVDQKTAKKLYEFLGPDHALDFAVRSHDADEVYNQVSMRLSDVAVDRDVPFYPNEKLIADGDMLIGTVSRMSSEQQRAVRGLMKENIDKLRQQIQDFNERESRGEVIGEVDLKEMTTGANELERLLQLLASK